MAQTVFEIPLTAVSQHFNITLDNVDYQFTIRWNDADLAQCWMIDIFDSNAELLVGGIPMVTGADLLAKYRHLGFIGSLTAQTDHDTDAVPTFDNLGTLGHLYYIPDNQ